MRLSIPKCHDQYLKTLAEQMNCSANEALTYLLWEVRRQGFSFASPLSLAIAYGASEAIATQQSQSTPVAGKFTPFVEIEPQEDRDPVIEKFLAIGLDAF